MRVLSKLNSSYGVGLLSMAVTMGTTAPACPPVPAGTPKPTQVIAGSTRTSTRTATRSATRTVTRTRTRTSTPTALVSSRTPTPTATPPAGGGIAIWSRRFGGSAGWDAGRAIAGDSSGNVVVAGNCIGTVDFGGGPTSGAGGDDVCVVKYSSTGTHLWSRRAGGSGGDRALGVAISSTGDVVVTGYFNGSVDFGGGPLSSAGGLDIFVAKYSGLTGTHQWSKRFGSTGDDVGYGVAVDGAGNVVITGAFRFSVSFGGGVLTSAPAAATDVFLAKYSAAGAHLWSKNFSNMSGDVGYAVAADATGNIALTGLFTGTVNFGGATLSSIASSEDVFVAKFSSAGTHTWSRGFGSGRADFGYGVGIDGSGNVAVTGVFQMTTDCGGGPLTSAGLDDVFVAKYAAATGAHLWSRRGGGVGTDSAAGLALDANGNVAIAGYFESTVNFGGSPLSSVAGYDIVVAKYAAGNGAHVWSKRFGGAGTDWGLAIGGNGAVLATGGFSGVVDFGTGPLTSGGLMDAFVLKLAP